MTLLLSMLLAVLVISLVLGGWHHSRCVQRYKVERREWRNIDERKHQWVATVCHDLRSPFNGILGIVDALRMPETLRETKVRNELIDLITLSARQGVAMVENLRCLERMRSGAAGLSLSAQSLPPLIQLAIQANVEKARCKSQCLVPRFDLGSHAARVHCDETAMVQVVSNLLDRACAHAPASTEIELHLRVLGDAIEIGVESVGAGILAQELESTGSVHGQGSDASATVPIGFYLTVITSLTEAMGGCIRVQDQGTGSGSRVWLRFPILSDS